MREDAPAAKMAATAPHHSSLVQVRAVGRGVGLRPSLSPSLLPPQTPPGAPARSSCPLSTPSLLCKSIGIMGRSRSVVAAFIAVASAAAAVLTAAQAAPAYPEDPGMSIDAIQELPTGCTSVNARDGQCPKSFPTLLLLSMVR